jgi:hypothetical protein
MAKSQMTLVVSLQQTEKNAFIDWVKSANVTGRNKVPSISQLFHRIAVAYQYNPARMLTIWNEIDGIYKEAESG